MKRSFKRLERVLELEKKQGFQNKAVVGGIRQFATYWVDKAREEAIDEVDRALVEQVAEVLNEYARMTGQETRAEAVQSLLDGLSSREERLGDQLPLPPEKKSPPPPKATVKKEPPSPTKEPSPPLPTELPSTPEPDYELPVEQNVAGLQQPVTAVKGIGPKLAQRLTVFNIETIENLLHLFPRRYDDYSLMKPINRLQYGEQVTIIGTIWETRARRTRNNQVLVQSIISDGTGKIQATWFNQSWLTQNLPAGMQIVLSGKVEQYLGRPVFNSPDWEPLELEPLRTRRIVPVYPLTKGLKSYKMRNVMQTAVSEWAAHVPDPLPLPIRQRQDLYSLPQAVQQIHFPDTQEALHHARHRLAFDELFLLQLGMQARRQEWHSQPGIPLNVGPDQLAPFYNSLPFHLTAAQQRVIDEIRHDMAQARPMNRLLQGDVGSGKTIVAAAAMFVAVRANSQAALMAPTEILAEQHYQGLHQLLEPLGVTTCLLTGSTTAAEKERIYTELAAGKIDVAIGTHALIQEGVTFANLTLAVIDEQHRFGVDQRGALRLKGASSENGEPNPHLLVMSATPIPRTLALSLYGDLDLSILDEMPPGRQEIKTYWLKTSERERAYQFVRRQVQAGRQAYMIYPLVEESDKIDAKAAVEEYERLQQIFPELKLGLVHGRLKAAEKEAAMRAFKEGETNILVATSVIEVGVDVPNSTIIVIEGADRFGLAQLHQFRGRVGRGVHQSYCLLIADGGSADGEERMKALEQTNDGFVLAEKDLSLRGPGQFFGRQQSGLPELRMASLLDMAMVELAREEAVALFTQDPYLQQPEHAPLHQRVEQFWADAGDVS
ncbi:MAG: ATP-dependent DNA helicase RecG [Chloroflexota bacterium]|jgi:ATP-dependent DNA helicase RecG